MKLSKCIFMWRALIIRVPWLLALQEGFVNTHPNLFACYMIWDTIESHHKMQHSPTYGPFGYSLAPMLAGDIPITHFNITDPQQLKKALEMPVTLTSHSPQFHGTRLCIGCRHLNRRIVRTTPACEDMHRNWILICAGETKLELTIQFRIFAGLRTDVQNLSRICGFSSWRLGKLTGNGPQFTSGATCILWYNHPASYQPSSRLPCCSSILHSIRIVRRILTDPENIITPKVSKSKVNAIPYKYLSQSSLILPVLPLLRIRKFDVHVTIHWRQSAVVFHPPLEFNNNAFAS